LLIRYFIHWLFGEISPRKPDERSGNNLTRNTTAKHPTLTATEQQTGTNRHK